MVNSALSILLSDLTSGLVGFIIATAFIVCFGEILPQAVCSRHALRSVPALRCRWLTHTLSVIGVGAATVWIVKIFVFLMFPIAWPLSWLLDKLLGAEVGQVYSKAEVPSCARLSL